MQGLRTSKTEHAFRREKYGEVMVEPVERFLGDWEETEELPDGSTKTTKHSDYCYDMPFEQVLERLLLYNPAIWADVVETQASWWANPPAGGSSQGFVMDIPDGMQFKSHPELGTPPESGVHKLAFDLYYDEIELVNPLGAYTGKHKVGMFYWSLARPPCKVCLLNGQPACSALAVKQRPLISY
jgi:hypothetical protein